MAQADRSHFEQEWENAFADARMKPSPQVWRGIEQSLHGGHGNRKRIFLIQLAMAASVLFAMSIGAAGVYQLFFNQSDSTAPVVMNEKKTDNPAASSSDLKPDTKPEEYPAIQPGKGGDDELPPDGEQIQVASAHTNEQTGNPKVQSLSDAGQAPLLVEGSVKSSFDVSLERLDPFSGTLAYQTSLPEVDPVGVPYAVIPVKESHGSWASLGISAGNYHAGSSAMNSYALGSSLDNAVSVGRVSEESTGSVFQLNMNVGKRFAKRWLIQGGLGYLERNSNGISNLISPQGDAVYNLTSESRGTVVLDNPYRIENSMQVVTVPVQIGYVVLDKKLGLRVLTGISNELMVKYLVRDTEGNFSSQSFRAGDSEDYNTYGMSALVTTEVSYTLAERYQVALQPQMRQSLMPLKETDSSPPRSLEVGFALRYLFQ